MQSFFGTNQAVNGSKASADPDPDSDSSSDSARKSRKKEAGGKMQRRGKTGGRLS